MWTQEELDWINKHPELVEGLYNTPSELDIYFTQLLTDCPGPWLRKLYLELGSYNSIMKLFISLCYLMYGPGCLFISKTNEVIRYDGESEIEYEIWKRQMTDRGVILGLTIHRAKLFSKFWASGTTPEQEMKKDAMNWLRNLGISQDMVEKLLAEQTIL